MIRMSEIREKFPQYPDLSDDDLVRAVWKKFYSDVPIGKFAATIERDTERQKLQQEITDEMPWYEKLAAGYGKAVPDALRGLGQVAGVVSRDDVKEARKLDAGLMRTGAGVAGNVLGNVALAAPAAFIPGVNSILGGTGVGLGLGAIQPSESTGETALNTLIGGVGGAASPVISRLWKTGAAALEPFSQSGKERIVGRALIGAAGRDAPDVAARLEQAGAPFIGPSQGAARTTMGELVPGSMPTVGQAAQNPGIAALERAALATNPSVTTSVTERMTAQNAARVDALSDIAGTSGARDFFAADRKSVAEALYGAARKKGVNPKTVEKLATDIEGVAQRIPKDVLGDAMDLARIKGIEMTDATSINGMHWIKQALDGAISVAKRAGNSTREEALVGLQHDLLGLMDRLSRGYAKARTTYAAMSRPINQMDVAQELLSKSVNPLTGTLQPAAYAKSLSDRTAQQALRMPGAKLENVMENAQMNTLNSILADVQRSTAAQNAGRGVGSDTVQKLAYTNLLDEAGVPTFLREMKPLQSIGGLLGRAGDAAYGRANRELSQMIAEIMLDPGKAAEVMRRATPEQASIIRRVLNESGRGLLRASPATINALEAE